MNTSKEAEKAKAKKIEQPENQNDILDELNPDELAQMENNLPTKLPDEGLQSIFDALENDETPMREITGNYLDLNDFAEGEIRPYIFTGKTNFTTDKTDQKGDLIVKDAVTLVDKTGKQFICASTVIVNSLFKVEKIPCGCKIQVNGKVKGKNGNYFDCKVYVL